jgi:nitrite reductase/ring-hydroxylating ferredoxin subunit
MSVSNLKYFLIISLILFLSISCDKEKNDVIPDVYTDFYVDLVSDPYFFDLALSPGNSVTISSSTNNWGSKAAGYDNNGIIVYNASNNSFFAYDRTCPHCFVVNALSIAVNLDVIEAVCPQCSTHYLLPSYGTPTPAGPGQYPLKNYKAVLSGQYLHVWNSY